MFSAPKTRREYLQRSVQAPWVGAALVAVVMVLAVVYFVAIKAPPVARGGRTPTDLRMVYAGLCGLFAVGSMIYAPFAVRRHSTLLRRGRYTPFVALQRSSLEQHGMTPVTVTYLVDGVEQRFKKDFLTSQADEMSAANSLTVIYDPQRPSVAEVLPPGIAALPEQ